MLSIILALAPVIAPSPGGGITINEIRVDQSGSDLDEYFELIGPAGQSLDGLTYIVIGDGSGGSGVIESISDLTGLAIPADGNFLGGESSMTIAVPDATLSLGFENSDNVTHMLVSGFTGSSQEDLDTNDDGVFDTTPWTSIIDSVSLVETPNSGDQYYSSNTVGPDGTFAVAHAHVCNGVWEVASYDFTDDSPGDANNCSSITDCNLNGVDDATDIANGTSIDCDVNGVPDECDPDCGTNGIPDACENDCDSDGTPDDCEADTNNNGIPDDCEILDCNNNNVEDSVDIANGTSQDCDTNGVPDECENLDDCNTNGVADACDVSAGTSADDNSNNIPDECEGTAPAVSINEIRIDQSGSDNDEYVELAAAPGTVLDGLTYIVLGDNSSGSGAVECVVAISGTVGTSGLFLIAEDTFTLNGVTPDQTVSTSDYQSSLAFENSDNVTHMLVFAFGGAFGDNLDADQDGVLDSTPWLALLDSISLIESVGTGDLVYGSAQIGPSGSFVPAHVYRCPRGWVMGDFDFLFDSPGADNPDCGPGTSYCAGEASNCPCANGGDGTSGCANTSGGGATLSGSGSASIGADDLVLNLTGAISGQPCLFFQGNNQVNGGAGNSFGDGLRCAGFAVIRLEVITPDSAGDASTTISIATKGGVVIGDVRHYQGWYRDSASTCVSTFNLSNGLSLTWDA